MPKLLQTATAAFLRLSNMTPEIDPVIRRLGEVELFRGCSDDELAQILRICDTRDLAPGSLLCRQGQTSRKCVVVVDGTASVEVNGELVRTVGPGETIGEMALLTRSLRGATVTAVSTMTVHMIDGARFDEVLRKTPDVSLAILRRAVAMLQQVYVMAGRPEVA
jgi:CRP-like cAMP-binding protein